MGSPRPREPRVAAPFPPIRTVIPTSIRRALVLVAVAALSSACASRASARGLTRGIGPDLPDDTTRREVLGVVNRLFDAMGARDSAAMRELFVPEARLFGMRTRRDGTIATQVLPWDRFAAMVAGDTRARWTERTVGEPEVRVRGTLATVWAHYTFHFGDAPSHCGVDAVQLLQTAAGWRIVSLADTYETTGCPWQSETPR